MKKILFIFIAVLISINVGATKYYIDPTGVDDAGRDGSVGQEWLTLAYACTRAVTAGDTIYVNAGTYNETAQSVLAVGVSIMGAGVTSIITAATGINIITASSPAANAINGNQSISYLKFDGNDTTAYRAIVANYRSNVIVHNCTFEDFKYNALYFRGSVNGMSITPTNIIPVGVKVHDCIFDNCTQYDNNASAGHIVIYGQRAMEVYNNTFTQTARTGGGNNADMMTVDQHYGLKIYNNIWNSVDDNNNQHFCFFAEVHYSHGGFELYGNTFNGGASFDLSSSEKGEYNFGSKVYNNQWLNNAAMSGVLYNQPALTLESFDKMNDVYVYRNYFKNVRTGISLANITTEANNVWIYYNIIDGAGVTDQLYNYGIFIVSNYGSATPTPFNNIHVCNNVIKGYAYGSRAGIIVSAWGDITNMDVSNNIIEGFTHRGIRFIVNAGTPTITNLNVISNILYDNNIDAVEYAAGVTFVNDTESGTLYSDPLFVGTGTPPLNYKLQATSPAKDAGISVGLTKDYGGYSIPVGPLPDIGAWEYGADVTPPNWHPTGLGWDDIYFKNNFRDTVNFTVPPTIAGAPLNLAALLPSGLTATVNDLNATTGATGNLQGQINTLESDKLEKINAALSTGTITDATGITTAMLSRYMYYSEAAATDITSNPQIVNGTAGQIITIIGSSDTNTLTLDDGDGLRLSAQCVLGAGDTITLYYDGTLADWIEIGRSNN